MSTRIVVVPLAVAAMLGTPGAAAAEKVIEAQTVWRFDATRYTLDPGEPLLFKNDDAGSPGPHNVTATQKGPDGKPLFASETIGNGKQSPVAGAPQLAAGSYDFICTVHPFMQATLVVGAPAAASPSEPAPASPKPQAKGARVRARIARGSLTARRLFALVTTDKPAAMQLSLVARIGGRSVTVGRATATGKPGHTLRVAVPVGAGARKRLRALARATLTLFVEARDHGGRVTTAKATRTLRR